MKQENPDEYYELYNGEGSVVGLFRYSFSTDTLWAQPMTKGYQYETPIPNLSLAYWIKTEFVMDNFLASTHGFVMDWLFKVKISKEQYEKYYAFAFLNGEFPKSEYKLEKEKRVQMEIEKENIPNGYYKYMDCNTFERKLGMLGGNYETKE